MHRTSIKKNYIYRLFYEILQVIISFVTAPYIARVLGPDGVGIYSYTSSIMTYFTLLAALGTASYGAREIAQHRDDRQQSSKLFWEIELMTVITSFACLLVWIGVIVYSSQYRYYYLALIPMLLGTMLDISWYFTGLEQIKYIVVRNTICKLAGLIFLYAFVHKESDLFLYMVINSLIVLAGNLSMWTYLPKLLVKVDVKEIKIKKHFRETIIYFIPTLASSVYTVLDKTLLGLITKDSYQNGYYEQATRIINMIKAFVFTSVNAVVGVRNSYLFSLKKYDEIREKIINSMDFIIFVGMGSVFGLIGVASGFVPIFFGKGYEPVIMLLRIMAPIIIIIGISNCLGSLYFTPSGQRKRSAQIIVAGAVANLILNLLLIPRWGSVGATIASLIAESIISILYITMSDGYMSFKVLWVITRKRLIAGFVMCLTIMKVGQILKCNGTVVLILQIILGIGIYGILLWMMHDVFLQKLFGQLVKTAKNKLQNSLSGKP